MRAKITVEVAFALPDRQFLRAVTLDAGATVADAVRLSGIEREAGIDAGSLDVGVWSKPVRPDTPLHDGDRVELYRPLQVEPKEARRRRAERAARR